MIQPEIDIKMQPTPIRVLRLNRDDSWIDFHVDGGKVSILWGVVCSEKPVTRKEIPLAEFIKKFDILFATCVAEGSSEDE